jgi:hypothetical protein
MHVLSSLATHKLIDLLLSALASSVATVEQTLADASTTPDNIAHVRMTLEMLGYCVSWAMSTAEQKFRASEVGRTGASSGTKVLSFLWPAMAKYLELT